MYTYESLQWILFHLLFTHTSFHTLLLRRTAQPGFGEQVDRCAKQAAGPYALLRLLSAHPLMLTRISLRVVVCRGVVFVVSCRVLVVCLCL